MNLASLNIVLFGVLVLLGVGLYGLLIIRNLVRIIVALQILAKAVILALVIAGRSNGNLSVAQSLAVTVIVADTIIAVIGLALAVQVRRRCGTLDVSALSNLKG